MAKSTNDQGVRAQVGKRIDELKNLLGFQNFKQMAAELRRITGTATNPNLFSSWKRHPPSPEMLAAIAMLHPEPRLCLRWLREGGNLGRIHVDRQDPSKAGTSALGSANAPQSPEAAPGGQQSSNPDVPVDLPPAQDRARLTEIVKIAAEALFQIAELLSADHPAARQSPRLEAADRIVHASKDAEKAQEPARKRKDAG